MFCIFRDVNNKNQLFGLFVACFAILDILIYYRHYSVPKEQKRGDHVVHDVVLILCFTINAVNMLALIGWYCHKRRRQISKENTPTMVNLKLSIKISNIFYKTIRL